MKLVSFIACVLVSLATFAQKSDQLIGKVYTLNNSPQFATVAGNQKIRTFFDGSGAVLSQHRIKLITLQKGNSMEYSKLNPEETFLIIRKGPVKVTLSDGKTAVIDTGSVVCILPGDGAVIQANNQRDIEFYQMQYVSKAPADPERGKAAGPSFIMDWKDMVFKPTDKGGTRQLFDRKTTMLNRFDIHVTQLNEGNKSHDPHQHTTEEIILMLDGNAEMQIGTDHQKANPGDVVFLSSNILHNLTNIGKGACLYFAIQWN